MTYSISGKQAVLFHAALHLAKPLPFKTVFPNARLNNSIVNGLSNETHSIEASYLYRTPIIKIRATAYYSYSKNTTENSFSTPKGIFDDGAGYTNTDAFVGQTLTQLDKKNLAQN